jgi:PqqD family protein of HPr-rel-A system
MAHDRSWKVADSGELNVRYWDGDYVVYNPLNGSTHVLDIVTGEVLKAISAGRGRTSELCRSIAEFLEVPNDSSVADNLRDILAQLDDLGLIEPVNGC